MIKISGSRFTEAMPENMKGLPEVQAIAYAVGRQIEKLCAYADGARTYAAIQTMPARILDTIAVEMRTPAYSENLPLATKRELIMNTTAFYSKMGTPYAVKKIIDTIFGSGEVEEWFDYGGDPYHFRISSRNINEVFSNYSDFMLALESVKRKSAWIDSITVEAQTNTMPCYAGFAIQIGKARNIGCEITDVMIYNIYGNEMGDILTNEDGGIFVEE